MAIPFRNPSAQKLPLMWPPIVNPALRYQQAADAANAANIDRYNRAMNELIRMRAANQADVANLGSAARKDIQQTGKANLARVRQEMTQRGLAHSTVLPAVLAGAGRQTSRELANVYEQMARARIGTRQADTGAMVNLAASRNDQAPDPGLMAQLAQNFGAGGGYGGMGMGGGMSPGFQVPLQYLQQQEIMRNAWIQQQMANQIEPRQVIPGQMNAWDQWRLLRNMRKQNQRANPRTTGKNYNPALAGWGQ